MYIMKKFLVLVFSILITIMLQSCDYYYDIDINEQIIVNKDTSTVKKSKPETSGYGTISFGVGDIEKG